MALMNCTSNPTLDRWFNFRPGSALSAAAWQFLPILALFLTLIPPVLGQTAGPSQPQAQSDLQRRDALIAQGLEPVPFNAEALGLSINFPAGSNVVAERVENSLVLAVADDPSTPTWNLRIQQMLSTVATATAITHVEDLLRDIEASKQQHEVITNEPVNISGIMGHRCFVKRFGPQNQAYVSGWLILPNGPRSFLVFSLQTLPEHLPRLRPILDASFNTIVLQNTEELASLRKGRLDAGQAVLASITREQLESLVGLNHWYRIHSPGPANGAPPMERGYSSFEVVAAKKGALNPSKAEKSYTPDEHKPGIMVRVRGRIVINAERGVYYDSAAYYWMSWDQSEEAWSILGTHRQGEAEQSEAETAVRTAYAPGSPPPRLKVIKSDNSTNAREPFDWEVPEIYMSQVVHWLLARLLPKDDAGPREFSAYFYNFTNARPQVSQRLDIWEPARDGTGNFKLTTRLTSDSQPSVSYYDSEGALVRRVHPDGTLTEPSTPEELRKLWKSKGLQVGKIGG